MKYKFLFSTATLLLFLMACKKDNFDPPNAIISGRVVYQNQPIGLRTNGVQLELWQPGYAFFNKIPVYVNQDGTFSANVFDGDYKLTFLKGNGPWVEKTDTINVSVRGSIVVDVPVTPYFLVSNETFTYNAADTTISATYKVNQITAGKNADRLAIIVGSTNFVDVTNNVVTTETSTIPSDLTQTITQKVSLNPDRYPASNQAAIRQQLAEVRYKKYAFARIGVRAAGQSERIYSTVKQVNLQ